MRGVANKFVEALLKVAVLLLNILYFFSLLYINILMLVGLNSTGTRVSLSLKSSLSLRRTFSLRKSFNLNNSSSWLRLVAAEGLAAPERVWRARRGVGAIINGRQSD